MTHPHEAVAQTILTQLAKIQGVYASVVRAQADPFPTPTEIRTAVEALADVGDVGPDKSAWVEREFAKETERLEVLVRAAPSPFPHLTDGAPELCHYLRGLTDLIAPVDEERIDAKVEFKVGAMRFVAESWHDVGDAPVLVAVAIPHNDPGVKSLMRGIRRVRKKNRTT